MQIRIKIFALTLLAAMGCASIKNMAGKIEGTYYGYLPCASCPGIHYQLILNSDFTFTETLQYAGKNDVFILEDKFTLTRDSLIILKGKRDNEGMSRLIYKNGKLKVLSLSGEKIESGFSERYILNKGKPPVIREVEPITITGFKATGNEPFWGIEFEFGNIIKFTSLTEEYPELSFNMPDPERTSDISLIKYTAKTYNAEMIVNIARERCMDTMKGELFPYLVTVSIRKNHTDDYTDFRGCGQYLGTYRLNDKWILKKINGKQIEIPGSREHPQLEVDLAGKMIFGYGGCNRFHGRAELVNNNLVTGSIASTKIACPDTQDIENTFLHTLSEKTMEFRISDDTLVMTDGETELLFSRSEND